MSGQTVERVRPRDRDLRCPLCGGVVDEGDLVERVTCPGCATAVHAACASELAGGRCPTLGCGGRLAPAPRAAGASRGDVTRLVSATLAAGALSFLAGVALAGAGPGLPTVAGAALISLGLLLVSLGVVVKRLVLSPVGDEILVLSGRAHVDPETGEAVGYRFLSSEHGPPRVLALPVLEQAHRLEGGPLPVGPCAVDVTFQGGAPGRVELDARVRVAREPRLTRRAIERFLGEPSTEIAERARALLEGHLRAAAVTLGPERLAQIEEGVAASAPSDLAQLGLELLSVRVRAGK